MSPFDMGCVIGAYETATRKEFEHVCVESTIYGSMWVEWSAALL